MWDRLRYVWLPRLLFAVTLTVAVVLAVSVLIAPHLRPDQDAPRLLVLFADDPAVRRTSLASAVGLAVTAFVFFRSSGPRPRKPSPKESSSGNMAGA
jgi:hypothetical protein